jgi:hypothetical protein
LFAQGLSPKLSPKIAVMAALTLFLVLAVFPVVASAQNLRKDQAGNRYGPGLEKLGALFTRRTIQAPDCPDLRMKLAISNPYGLWIPEFDLVMAAKQVADVDKAVRKFFDEFEGPCYPYNSSSSEFEYNTTFEAHYSGGGVISIVYDNYVFYPGAAHPLNSFEAHSLNLRTGRELTMDDLFLRPPGAAEGLKRLWPLIAAGWCRYNDLRLLPIFYGLPEGRDWCANPGMIPLPKDLRGRPALGELGNAFLTADGLSLRLDGDNTWAHSFGTSTLNFDKQALIRLGFDPALWGR